MKLCPACQITNGDHVARCGSCAASLVRVPGGTSRIAKPETMVVHDAATPLPGIILSVVGAVVAGVLWVVIANASGWSLHILALAVGAATGAGMWLGLKSDCTVKTRVVAGALTLLAIIVCKFGIAEGTIARIEKEILAESASVEAMIGREAEALQTVHPDDYAEGGIDAASHGYPSELWAEATRTWNARSPVEPRMRQRAVVEERKVELAETHGLYLGILGGLKSFGGLSSTLFAIFLAVSIGSGKFTWR